MLAGGIDAGADKFRYPNGEFTICNVSALHETDNEGVRRKADQLAKRNVTMQFRGYAPRM